MIRQWLNWLVSLCHSGDDAEVLDHVPVKGKSLNQKKAVAKARERHGKEWKTHTKVYRTEPPSHLLQELEKASKAHANGAKLGAEITKLTSVERKSK